MKKADPINGVLLENKSKRKWVDKAGNVSFMLYPRAFWIVHGNDESWYSWKCFKEYSEENIEVIRLITVCWLEINGSIEVTELSPEVDYQVAFIMKLKTEAFGWELTNTLKLTLPNGQVHQRLVSLQEEPRGEWIEVSVGKFRKKKGETGGLAFNFSNSYGHWKGGMILKGLIIQPMKSTP